MEQKQLITIAPGNYESALRENIKLENEQADLAVKTAEKLVIKNDQQLKDAKEDFTIIRGRIRDLEDRRTSIVAPINAAVKAINDLFRIPADKLAKAKLATEQKVVAYERQKEEERLAEERRLREEAEREERKRREEKERQEREWREKEAKAKAEAEEKARKAQEATNAKEKARLEAEAEKARQIADKAKEKADSRAIEASEVFVAPKTVEKVAVKVAGTRQVERWFAQVIDESKIPDTFAGRSLWKIDESALNELAKSLKTRDCPIPGVRFYSESKLS